MDLIAYLSTIIGFIFNQTFPKACLEYLPYQLFLMQYGFCFKVIDSSYAGVR